MLARYLAGREQPGTIVGRDLEQRRGSGAGDERQIRGNIVVTILGGALGVLAAYGATAIATRFEIGGSDTRYAITAQWVILGLAVSAITGVIAGVYPAWRASRLDPIEALRHE